MDIFTKSEKKIRSEHSLDIVCTIMGWRVLCADVEQRRTRAVLLEMSWFINWHSLCYKKQSLTLAHASMYSRVRPLLTSPAATTATCSYYHNRGSALKHNAPSHNYHHRGGIRNRQIGTDSMHLQLFNIMTTCRGKAKKSKALQDIYPGTYPTFQRLLSTYFVWKWNVLSIHC